MWEDLSQKMVEKCVTFTANCEQQGNYHMWI